MHFPPTSPPRCDFMWKGSKGFQIWSAMKTKWSIHDHNDNNHEEQIRSFGCFMWVDEILYQFACMKSERKSCSFSSNNFSRNFLIFHLSRSRLLNFLHLRHYPSTHAKIFLWAQHDLWNKEVSLQNTNICHRLFILCLPPHFPKFSPRDFLTSYKIS